MADADFSAWARDWRRRLLDMVVVVPDLGFEG